MTATDAMVGTRDVDLDDRILPVTRTAAGLVIPFIFTASAMLFLFPDHTKELFAWTIHPRMTPMVMGAGYGGGVYFWFRVVTGKQWHRVALGFLSSAAFAWVMGIATILHLGKFNHHHISFFAWALLYATLPFILPALFLVNRSTDPRTPDPGEPMIPTGMRWAWGTFGAVMIVAIGAVFIRPTLMIDRWPWTVTPLTMRVLAGFFALAGVAWLVMALDGRWDAAKIPLETVIIGMVLIVIAVPFAWRDFDTSNPLTWVYIGSLAAALVGQVAFYAQMQARRTSPATAAAVPAGA